MIGFLSYSFLKMTQKKIIFLLLKSIDFDVLPNCPNSHANIFFIFVREVISVLLFFIFGGIFKKEIAGEPVKVILIFF